MVDETIGEELPAEGNRAHDPGEAKERRIRIRAYEIWEQEGRPEGRDVERVVLERPSADGLGLLRGRCGRRLLSRDAIRVHELRV